ncbi:MAG: hypothetical protein LLG97_08220 [Deltaproteobacteria bacterium]|nr:hypothetical protein [Deltaproteobacteria bacterium]
MKMEKTGEAATAAQGAVKSIDATSEKIEAWTCVTPSARDGGDGHGHEWVEGNPRNRLGGDHGTGDAGDRTRLTFCDGYRDGLLNV